MGNEIEKICIKCGVPKSLDGFQFRNDTGKHRSYCQICKRNQKAEHYQENKESILKRQKEYREKNTDRLNAARREKYSANITENREKSKIQSKKYRERYPERRKETNRKYCEKNPEKRKEYYQENKEHLIKQTKINRVKRSHNPSLKMISNIKRAFNKSLKNNSIPCSKTFEKYIGVDIKKYIAHLKGDTLWDQYCIDHKDIALEHIIPISAYDFNNHEEIVKCWNFKNLRLLANSENSKKRNKIDWDLIEKHNIYDLLPDQLREAM